MNGNIPIMVMNKRWREYQNIFTWNIQKYGGKTGYIKEGVCIYLGEERQKLREEKYVLFIYVILYQQPTDQAENMLKKMCKVDVEARNKCTI